MAINVLNNSGGVLGSISNGKILNTSGGVLGGVSGNKILNNSGGVLASVSNGKILNNSGGVLAGIQHGPLGIENGNMVLNNSGGVLFHVDDGASDVEIGAAAIFLWHLGEEQTKPDTQPVSSSGSSEKPGCLGYAFAFFGMIFFKLPIAGKICALVGLVLPIVGSITEANGNYILMIPFGFLIGGGIGALGNFVIPKLSKAGKLGTLIGAVVIGVLLGILGGSNSTKDILSLAIMGLIAGAIAGAIIGSIVGLVKKLIDKRK